MAASRATERKISNEKEKGYVGYVPTSLREQLREYLETLYTELYCDNCHVTFAIPLQQQEMNRFGHYYFELSCRAFDTKQYLWLTQTRPIFDRLPSETEILPLPDPRDKIYYGGWEYKVDMENKEKVDNKYTMFSPKFYNPIARRIRFREVDTSVEQNQKSSADKSKSQQSSPTHDESEKPKNLVTSQLPSANSTPVLFNAPVNAPTPSFASAPNLGDQIMFCTFDRLKAILDAQPPARAWNEGRYWDACSAVYENLQRLAQQRPYVAFFSVFIAVSVVGRLATLLLGTTWLFVQVLGILLAFALAVALAVIGILLHLVHPVVKVAFAVLRFWVIAAYKGGYKLTFDLVIKGLVSEGRCGLPFTGFEGDRDTIWMDHIMKEPHANCYSIHSSAFVIGSLLIMSGCLIFACVFYAWVLLRDSNLKKALREICNNTKKTQSNVEKQDNSEEKEQDLERMVNELAAESPFCFRLLDACAQFYVGAKYAIVDEGHGAAGCVAIICGWLFRPFGWPVGLLASFLAYRSALKKYKLENEKKLKKQKEKKEKEEKEKKEKEKAAAAAAAAANNCRLYTGLID